MIYIEFTISVVLAIIALYAQEENMPKRSELSHLWNSCPKWLRIVVLIVLALSPSVIGWVNNREAQKEQEANEVYKRNQQASLDEANNRLVAATNKIEVQARMLVEQSATIADQSRTIGSIAYNTQTTFAGKQRFIRCFKDLSRLTSLKDEGARFEGLVCDDGVAMYWFDPKSDLPTGFHFFPNDELNRVLSGIPVDENVVDSSGRLTIPADSELSIALNEALSRRTPSLPVSTSGPMKERTDDAIIAELTTLFRYVYRAESSQFTLAYFKGTHKTDGTRSLMFQYLVDPFAENPHLRTVSGFMLTPAFMKSLYGVTIADFSQLVIAECNRLGIEPKIRLSDVCQLNAIRALDERKHNSPFRQLHKEGK